jgi:hypothetical protein
MSRVMRVKWVESGQIGTRVGLSSNLALSQLFSMVLNYYSSRRDCPYVLGAIYLGIIASVLRPFFCLVRRLLAQLEGEGHRLSSTTSGAERSGPGAERYPMQRLLARLLKQEMPRFSQLC